MWYLRQSPGLRAQYQPRTQRH